MSSPEQEARRCVRPVAERTPTPDESDPIFALAESPHQEADSPSFQHRQPVRRGMRRRESPTNNATSSGKSTTTETNCNEGDDFFPPQEIFVTK